MKFILPIVGAALALSACSSPAPVEDAQAAPIDMVEPVEKAAPAPAAIEAAKTALAAEPQIKDLTYNAADTVQWNVGVRNDGSSRVGYAEYVCQVLQENGALAGRTHVRVVDIAKVEGGSDFRSANLGHVICETGDVIGA